MMSETVIYVRETKMDGLISDAITVASTVAIIGIGVFLDSSAMQWVGFVLAILLTIGRSMNSLNTWKCPPQEVADKLKQKYGVVAE